MRNISFTAIDESDITEYYTRDDFIKNSYWKAGDLGSIQFRHNYDRSLLETIKNKAIARKEELGKNLHVGLNYIRSAHHHIPEINELLYDSEHIAALSEFAGITLEPYPLSVIAAAITYMSQEDGNVDWHSDGPAFTQLIPLVMEDVEGGELEIYCEQREKARLELQETNGVPNKDKIISIKHNIDYSIFSQLHRCLHRTAPLKKGLRITLNLTFRSKEQPYIDDNTMWYLGADNPKFEWLDELVKDVKEHQLPAYIRDQEKFPRS